MSPDQVNAPVEKPTAKLTLILPEKVMARLVKLASDREVSVWSLCVEYLTSLSDAADGSSSSRAEAGNTFLNYKGWIND